ncbi:MAG TPA: hypothetical protein VGD52_15460, partial [Pseudoduganella sp.]
MLAAIIGCVTLTACGGGGGAPETQLVASPSAPAPTAAPAPVVTAGLIQSSTVNTTQSASGSLLLTPTTVLTSTTAIVAGAQITDVRFENTGAAQTGVPVTFGHAFAVGAVAASDAVVGNLPDGTMVPLQVDVKARHADGSIRHAVISAVLPSLAAAETQTMALVKTTPYAPNTASDPAALLASGFTAAANVTLDGQQYSASADALLKGAKVTTWLAGAIVNEWHVSAPLKSAQGVSHPHLIARFAIRSYNGSKKTRVDLTIENNWAYEDAPQNFVYDAQVLVGGQPVFTKSALTHYHHARWRKVFWWGQEPQVHVKHNTGYLIATKAVPNYDQSVAFPETTLAAMKTTWTGTKTELMGVGAATQYMPATGAHPDIGLMPSWSATYLLSMDKRAKQVTMGTADLAGSWSAHYRDRNTDRPISVLDYPYMTTLGLRTDTMNKVTKQLEAFPICPKEACVTPHTHDTAHQPSLAYLPYLVSGDYYYLEELQFWTMFNVLSSNPGYREFEKGLVKSNQVRAQAWALRSLGEAAYITPDSDPLKSHFQTFVKNNLDWYNAEYTNNPSANKLGIFTHSNATVYNSGTGTAPWMEDFVTSATGFLVDLGFSDAIPLLQWKSKFVIGRMTDPSACWIRGAAYTVKVRASANEPVFDTIGESYRATFASDPANLVCGSAEMATFLKLKVGEMTGYAAVPTGYPSNMQPAVAYVAGLSAGGLKAWSV